MHKELWSVGRLAGLLASLALATSRLGLVAHELVGHGGTALACGGDVTAVRLFWFAGGWVSYRHVHSMAAMLAVSMGGIAVELVIGTTLWLVVRRPSLGARLVRGCSAALILHASWYLATGAWHGYGDGQLLYHWLGAARAPVAIAAGLVTCAAAFAGAREVIGAIADTLLRHRFAGTLVAMVLAAGLHAGLALGELHVRNDRAYASAMAPERDREIAIEMARWRKQQPTATPDAQRDEQASLEREHRTFPFAWLLALATMAAAIAGIVRRRPGTGEPISRRLLLAAVLGAAFAIASVIALDALL